MTSGLEYIVHSVGWSAFVVEATPGVTEHCAHVDFVVSEVDQWSEQEGLGAVVRQCLSIGTDIEREPWLRSINDFDIHGSNPVHYRGIGLVVDGILQYHPIDRTAIARWNEDAHVARIGTSQEIVEQNCTDIVERMSQVLPAPWTFESALGPNCVAFEYKRRAVERSGCQ
jgi:hypothetical protein